MSAWDSSKIAPTAFGSAGESEIPTVTDSGMEALWDVGIGQEGFQDINAEVLDCGFPWDPQPIPDLNLLEPVSFSGDVFAANW